MAEIHWRALGKIIMIAFISGKIRLVNSDFIVVEAGEVGYKVYVSEKIIEDCHKTSGRIELYIYHHQTDRESSLFGFKTHEKLSMFELLLGVPGVGPKAAANVLSTLSVDAIKTAVISNDPEVIAEAQGVGKKVAGKIIRELEEKFEEGDLDIISEKTNYSRDALDALQSLGYNQIEARAALRMVGRGVKNTQKEIKLALKYLGNSVK